MAISIIYGFHSLDHSASATTLSSSQLDFVTDVGDIVASAIVASLHRLSSSGSRNIDASMHANTGWILQIGKVVDGHGLLGVSVHC